MKKIFYISLLSIIMLIMTMEGIQANPIIITPKWTAQAQFVGYYVAEQKGFYKEEGVDVRIVHPAISESSFSVLQQGRSQVAVMNLSFALTARAAGAKIVNIMQTSQINSLMLVSRKPVKKISDLNHKKIAVWNHLSQDLLDHIAAHYGIQVEWIRFNSGINLFLSGAVDICLVGRYNEYLQLAECGFKTDSVNFFHFTDHGYNLPEDGLYVTEEFYLQHPEIVTKLVRASIKGWQWANKHREEALDMVMEKIHINNIGSNRYHQRRMMEELFQMQKDKQSGKATFRLSQEGFNTAMQILLDSAQMAQLKYEDFVK